MSQSMKENELVTASMLALGAVFAIAGSLVLVFKVSMELYSYSPYVFSGAALFASIAFFLSAAKYSGEI